jgi:leader peptidase (prepilin peptidase) / N-methyltransferase
LILPVAILASTCGILGAILGSFIGALCTRWPNGRSILSGRSHCDGCGRVLKARELVPLFSYAMQRGRCKGCDAVIDPLQFVAELSALIIGMVAFGFLALPQAVSFAIMGWILLPLILLDYRHLWLPNPLIFMLALSALLTGYFMMPDYDWWVQIIAACFAFSALELIRHAFRAIRHKEGMGAGDPKLMGAIALWLPPLTLPYLLLIASAFGLTHALLTRNKTDLQNQKLPFGALLCLAAMIIQFHQAL